MNALGFRTLLAKETRRFLKVPGQTLAQPVVTTTLYFLVFGYALGGRVHEVDGVSYVRFIIPGLVLLTLTQNAFLNTSSSMFIAKMQGTIVDLLIAPLGVVRSAGGVPERGRLARLSDRRARLAHLRDLLRLLGGASALGAASTRCSSPPRSRRSAWRWRSGATSSSSSTSCRRSC